MTLAVALMMSGAAFAQSDNQSCCNAQSGNKQGQRPSQEQMAQRMTERMVSTYGLTDAQKTKLLALNKKYAGKIPMGGPRGGKGHGPGMGQKSGAKVDGQTGATQQVPSSEERTKRRQEMKTNREAYNKELKAIFTDSQYKKYTENEQSREQRHQTRAQSRSSSWVGSRDATAYTTHNKKAAGWYLFVWRTATRAAPAIVQKSR